MTTTMKVIAGTTQVVGRSGTLYEPDVYGRINVQPGDVGPLIDAGAAFPAFVNNRSYNAGAAAAASATLVTNGAALANGAIAIAAQPDVPRPLIFAFIPGAAAITAGLIAIVYWGNDGQEHTENVSLITPSGVTKSYTTLFGAALLVSQTVSGLVGGSTPTINVGTTASLALPMSPNGAPVNVYLEETNAASNTVSPYNPANGVITPATAPDAGDTFAWNYTETVGS
jgi:hypothetical protein